MRTQLLTLLAICAFTFQSFSQSTTNNSELTIQQIMQGERFVGFLPENVSWSDDGMWIYFTWNPDQDTLRSLYKVSMQGGDPVKVSDEEMMEMPSEGNYNKARTTKVYSKNGDLFITNLLNDKTLQITNTIDRESNPFFTGDEKKIIYQAQNDLYSWEPGTGVVTQLTNFQKGSKRSEKYSPPHEEWLENDQMSWFEVLQWREAQGEIRKRQNEKRQPERPEPFYYGSKSISNIQLSPSEQFVTFRLTKQADAKNTDVPNYVTESGHVEDLRSRSKVGAPQDTYEMGICDLELDTCYLINPKQIEGIYDKPAFLKEYHEGEEAWNSKYDSPREVIYHGPFFNENSQALVNIKSMDNKDRWLMLLDLPTGNLKLLDRQHDEAWIGGPGIVSWNFSAGNLGWMPDNQHVWFQSEESGYSHIYTVNVKTGKKKALTSGKFEIINAEISHEKKYFFITANKESPFEHHFYRLPIGGGKMEKITSKKGGHQVTLSPDQNWLAVRYSYSNKPWELYVMKNEPGAEMTQLTHSTTKGFEQYQWRDPEVIQFTARDGAKVPARIYRPDPSKKTNVAVIFVHGAGYLQNVHHWWSSYYREFMFHNILVDNGYTVLDIDYRASNGYGRDWRTAIYRHMGGWDLNDQIDGAKYLTENHGIDADRIGIYGGSYGGFITLMALFTSPGTFKCGAALRSVTDWAHYNHPYTSNILNTPVEDSLAYLKSSPIYHAEGLQDHLLILHGMIDTNVQFQDVVRLAQRLIELGKENWEFAVFPLERHGFVEPSSWTDEYRRIFKLFQEQLKE
jgi:acetyl esterase/lipase